MENLAEERTLDGIRPVSINTGKSLAGTARCPSRRVTGSKILDTAKASPPYVLKMRG